MKIYKIRFQAHSTCFHTPYYLFTLPDPIKRNLGPAKGGIFRLSYFRRIRNTFFSVFRKPYFRIASKSNNLNFAKLTKLTKENILGPKMYIWGQKHTFWGQKHMFQGQKKPFRGQKYTASIFLFQIFHMYKIFETHSIPCKWNLLRQNWIFSFAKKTRSDSTFNQKFDYDYVMQGLKRNAYPAFEQCFRHNLSKY